MNMCEFFPEITNCVNCEYFDLREINSGFSDYEPICLKREEEKTNRIEEKKQTFAEWLLNFVKTHPESYITMEKGSYGEFTMRMCDASKRRPIASKCSLPGIEYEQSELTIDEIFIDAAENLEKEIENYGK